MPKTAVVVFAAEDGSAPLLAWLDNLQVKVRDKCIVRIERLEEYGHALRMPEADFLQDGIHELRIQHRRVQYRILYFFHQELAVLSHGCTKEGMVPPVEIGRAVKNRERFIQNPSRHVYKE